MPYIETVKQKIIPRSLPYKRLSQTHTIVLKERKITFLNNKHHSLKQTYHLKRTDLKWTKS